MRRWRLGAIVIAAVLAGCEADPPRNCTTSACTLVARGPCAGKGEWRFEYKQVAASTWRFGPLKTYDCGGGAGEGAEETWRVTGLAQDTRYHFRIYARNDAGEVHYFGRDGRDTPPEEFSTEADHGAPLGKDYAEGSAIPSVNADKVCYFRNQRHPAYTFQETAWARTHGQCSHPDAPKVYITCKALIFTGADYEQDVRYGFNHCGAAEARVPGWPGERQGSEHDLYFLLLNPARRWTGYFNAVYQDKLDCERTLVPDEADRNDNGSTQEQLHRLHCWHSYGDTFGGGPSSARARAGLSPRSWAHPRGREE